MMDWIKITEDQWVVLTNQFNAEKLQTAIENIAKTRSHGITLVQMTKKKVYVPDGYIEAKNDELSERLLTGKY